MIDSRPGASPPPYERDATIAAVFLDRALERPGATAVVDAAGALSYGELDRAANRVANRLIRRGVGPGSTVGVGFERSIALPAVLLGILRAGAAYVPLDPSYPPDRLAFMAADAALGLVVVGASGLALDASAAPRVTANDLLAPGDESEPPAAGGPLAPAYIMYTSGSTGRPKGVVVPNRGVVRLVRGTDFVSVERGDTFLHLAPLAFDASTFELWAPLLNGATLAIAEPGLLSLRTIAETVRRYGVTTLWLAASMFRETLDGEPSAFAPLRQLVVGGDVVSPAHARRFVESFPRCRLVNGYGPTENTTFSCCYAVASAESIGDSVPIGTAIAHSTAHVLDSSLRPVAPGTVGELYVGGDGVALGYLKLATATADRFMRDPFSDDPQARLFRTGDRVLLRHDGVLEFRGRSDDQVKVRGFRIELGEIEAALFANPAVREAAVVVVETAGYKEIVTHIVPAGAPLDERALREDLARTLPGFMLPNHFVACAQLPHNPSGKVDRGALASAPVPPRPVAPRFGRATDERLERAIAEVWREVLGREGALDENFFDAGGDSLRLLAMHARLRQQLDVDLSVTDLFEQSTIRKLASFVARSQVRA